MTLFTRSLWPASVHAPYRRLLIALVVSPLAVSAALTLVAFLLAGMSEKTAADVLAVTVDFAIVLTALVHGFTFTFGLLGVAILWTMGQRGPLSWMVTGLLFGAVAGMLFGELALNDSDRALLVVFAITGMVHFTLVRLIAGIQEEIRSR